jgi:hypothetical protein
MNRSAILVAMVGLLAAAAGAAAQDMREGTWTGTHQRTDGNNRAVQKINVDVKKVPDPHWAWRPTATEVWSVTFNGPPVGRAQVANFKLEAATLTFSYMRQDLTYECKLQQQPGDAFVGRCVSDGTQQAFRITLNPPAPIAKD